VRWGFGNRRVGVVLSRSLAAAAHSDSSASPLMRFIRRACPQDVEAGRSRRALRLGDVVAATSVQELMGGVLAATMAETSQTRAYMIGGGALATEMLEAGLIDEFVLSVIEERHEGDTFLHEHELRRCFSDVEVLRRDTEFEVRRYYSRRCPSAATS
jgi:hypothetical protein